MSESNYQTNFGTSQIVCHQELIFRLKSTPQSSGRLLLLLHGWTGDENSLWDIANLLPDRDLILAPRGLHADPKGGYAWREIKPGSWGFPAAGELYPAAEALIRLLDELGARNSWDTGRLDVVGYSQGAVLTLILALLHPHRIRKMGLISGFLPKNPEPLFKQVDLQNLSTYIAHGTNDEQIPIDRARQMAAMLEQAGAKIVFTELDSGHRVLFEQLNGLAAFLSQEHISPAI